MKLKAVALGLDARYSEARDLLESLNEKKPRQLKKLLNSLFMYVNS